MKYTILAALIGGTIVLTSCQNNHTNLQNNKDSQYNTNQNKEEHVGATKEDETTSNASQPAKNSSSSSSKDTTASIKNQLKMEGALLPTIFPISKNGYLAAKIAENTLDSYSVNFYQTDKKTAVNDSSLDTNKEIPLFASFSAKKYTNDSADKQKDLFSTTTNVDQIPDEMAVDLGHGIKGITEGAAGHKYLAWQEGRWILQIESLSVDNLDQVGIAKKMVAYLEKHSLPVPHDKGRVKVNYKQGGDKVEVSIYWQNGETVYQLETEEVPNNALMMAVSVE
ncbi:MAG: hypothetical protein ABF649_20130 [Bacillus sp. (in: firmicutes)]